MKTLTVKNNLLVQFWINHSTKYQIKVFFKYLILIWAINFIFSWNTFINCVKHSPINKTPRPLSATFAEINLHYFWRTSLPATPSRCNHLVKTERIQPNNLIKSYHKELKNHSDPLTFLQGGEGGGEIGIK